MLVLVFVLGGVGVDFIVDDVGVGVGVTLGVGVGVGALSSETVVDESHAPSPPQTPGHA